MTAKDFIGFLILSMAVTYGAPADADRTTAWVDVGTDTDRLILFEEVEDFAAVGFSDEQRESVQTLGCLIDLVTQGELA